MPFNRLGTTHAEVDNSEVMFAGANIPTRSTDFAKTGLRSWKMASTQSFWGHGFPAQTGVRAGLHMYSSVSVPGGDCTILACHETLTSTWPHRVVWKQNELRWDLYVNNALEDQVDTNTIGVNVTGVWYHVAMTVDSVGGYCTVYLDGNAVLTYSGAISSADVDFVSGMYALETNAFTPEFQYIDNFYVDEIDTESDAAPPAYEFLQSYVDGANTANWTVSGAAANWQAVDDGPTSDGDATYNKVSTSAGALEDRHETAAIALPADYIITAAHSYALAKKLDSAMDAQIELSTHDGISGDYSPTPKELPISYRYLWERFPLQPDNSAWNETDFNAMRFGYRAAGSF
jgi:hypothetical protein